ncbi:SRPBCC family protein [Nocardia brevicatena]|uniref:SRPBCC family protein n=1 Tax=Nocardia brevicatena TaxID=37327 RepID=UPI0003114562|nr:SRPBCC family protein [Nocardia brevicatena]
MTTTPDPNGRLRHTATGRDLVLTRTYRAPIDDIWASITEPERTARWIGPWEGEAGPGKTVRLQMVFEEEQLWFDATIDICEPPRRLVIRTIDDHGSWHLEAVLSERDGTTELVFTHHLDSEANIAEVGPGWEYYLDALGASRTGAPRPDFDDYFPAMKSYYEGLES